MSFMSTRWEKRSRACIRKVAIEMTYSLLALAHIKSDFFIGCKQHHNYFPAFSVCLHMSFILFRRKTGTFVTAPSIILEHIWI